jgi:hypothetical protein
MVVTDAWRTRIVTAEVLPAARCAALPFGTATASVVHRRIYADKNVGLLRVDYLPYRLPVRMGSFVL